MNPEDVEVWVVFIYFNGKWETDSFHESLKEANEFILEEIEFYKVKSPMKVEGPYKLVVK